MSIIVGIDPGLSGAIAILQEGHPPSVIDTPTTTIKSGKKNKRMFVESTMVTMLATLDPKQTHVAMEKIHSMPGQGVAAMFSMGEGYGLWRGILAALYIPYTLVTPQAWKKEMMAGMGKEKSASCYRAQQLFPGVEVFGPKGGAKDGRGDALLIAEYARRHF
jgi:crossover junction endodeoxyribonuclease RuvC